MIRLRTGACGGQGQDVALSQVVQDPPHGVFDRRGAIPGGGGQLEVPAPGTRGQAPQQVRVAVDLFFPVFGAAPAGGEAEDVDRQPCPADQLQGLFRRDAAGVVLAVGHQHGDPLAPPALRRDLGQQGDRVVERGGAVPLPDRRRLPERVRVPGEGHLHRHAPAGEAGEGDLVPRPDAREEALERPAARPELAGVGHAPGQVLEPDHRQRGVRAQVELLDRYPATVDPQAEIMAPEAADVAVPAPDHHGHQDPGDGHPLLEKGCRGGVLRALRGLCRRPDRTGREERESARENRSSDRAGGAARAGSERSRHDAS